MGRTFLNAVMALLFVVFYTSCSKEVKHQVLELTEYDSISVAIDYPILSNYVRLVPYVRNGELFVVGYNHFEHYYDFVNLSGGKHFSVEMEKEGPDGVLVSSRFWVNEDYIVCRNDAGLVMLGMDGKVRHRMPIEELLHPTDVYVNSFGGVALGNYDYVQNDGSRCFIPMISLRKDVDVAIGKVYDAKTSSLELLPILYPDSIRNLYQVKSLITPYMNGYADRIVYNFPISSKVYCYDLKTKKTKVMDMRSETIPNAVDMEEFKNMDWFRRMKEEDMTSRFLWAHYSAKSGKYYRVHFASRENFEDDANNKRYLMVYDEKTGEIKEYLLPARFSATFFIHDDVIYFDFDGTNDEVLTFAKIDLMKL